MNLEVSGAGVNPNKIMFALGMLFVTIGVIMGIVGVSIVVSTGEAGMVFFPLVFLVVFGGIGGFFAYLGYKGMHAKDAILEEGASITVPLGMSRYCPYCDAKISVDAEGRLLR